MPVNPNGIDGVEIALDFAEALQEAGFTLTRQRLQGQAVQAVAPITFRALELPIRLERETALLLMGGSNAPYTSLKLIGCEPKWDIREGDIILYGGYNFEVTAVPPTDVVNDTPWMQQFQMKRQGLQSNG